MPSINGFVSRLLFLSGWIAALLAITARPEYDASSAHAEQTASSARMKVETAEAPEMAEVVETAYHEAEPNRVPAIPETCSPWEVSPMAMEAVLDEMVQQGWQPPTQGDFLATVSADGAIGAVNPASMLWVDTPRSNPLDNQFQAQQTQSVGFNGLGGPSPPTGSVNPDSAGESAPIDVTSSAGPPPLPKPKRVGTGDAVIPNP
jgi:hypothetical protein